MPKRSLITQAECDRIRLLVELGKPRHYIRTVTKRCYTTIQRVVDRGFKPLEKPMRPVPAGFAEDCRALSVYALAKKYVAGKRTVLTWIAIVDPDRPSRKTIKGRKPHNAKPVPEGFRAYYEAYGWSASMRRFQIGSYLMHRWVARTGGPVTPPKRAKIEPVPMAMPAPPPGYEDFKRRLPPPPTLYGVAA